MRIDAITVCAGELYAEYLRRTLSVWLNTLDTLTIVTDDLAPMVAAFTGPTAPTLRNNVKAIERDVLTANGAHFNKGAALNEAYAVAAPTDWVLSFDCDTEPPTNWRTIAEPCLESGKLYGCRREGSRKFKPYGYFQLWHSQDPHAAGSPLFSEDYGHAGRYDTVFMDRWFFGLHTELAFQVKHHGERCRHWFGVGNEHLMGPLLRGGVAAYRDRDEKINEPSV